ncbi:hypothetical protein FQR65_LT14190 [Abscondita terminalis]|nr:hypothetical protein FQR65_LT14190 [Abscondita terminalis]
MQSNLQVLEQKIEVLAISDKQMFDLLISTNTVTDEILNYELSLVDEYTTKHFEMKLYVEQWIKKESPDDCHIVVSQRYACSHTHSRRKLNLRKLEFQKFSGDIKHWVSWWSQFRRIHEDNSMENEDKYQYLIQATPKSQTRYLVESYPTSGENYPKVIESLKQRFGRDEFLVEFYIRELLKLKRCQFCEDFHSSEDCPKVRTWTLDEKKERIKRKGCCFLCLRFSHLSRMCRFYLICTICKGRHFAIMYPKTEKVQSESKIEEKENPPMKENNLYNTNYSQVFLQVLVVRLYNENDSRNVRLLIDTGSQRNITKRMAKEMQYKPVGEEEIIFVIDSGPGPWFDELQSLGIQVTDCNDGSIDLLVGADIAGKLYTGERHELKCGLVTMKTVLGWTLVGKAVSPIKEKKPDYTR